MQLYTKPLTVFGVGRKQTEKGRLYFFGRKRTKTTEKEREQKQ